MDRLTEHERERALWAVNAIALLRGKGGYLEQEIAEKAGFNSVEHMQQRCKQRRYVGGLPNALDTLGWAQLLGGEPERAKSPFVESITLVK